MEIFLLVGCVLLLLPLLAGVLLLNRRTCPNCYSKLPMGARECPRCMARW